MRKKAGLRADAPSPTEAGQGSLVWLGAFTLVAFAILISLGVWQLHRLSWKEALAAKTAARSTGEPVALAEAMARLGRGEDIEFLKVRAEGRFDHGRERHLFTAWDGEAGWLLITPLETPDGATLLVNRGFVPMRLEDPSSRPESQPAGEVAVTGLVRLRDIPGTFTPDNQPEANRWYWRDLEGLSRSMFGDRRVDVAPFFLDAEGGDPKALPRGISGPPELPNRHLEYALTWFGLAATLIGVFVAYVLSRVRGRANHVR